MKIKADVEDQNFFMPSARLRIAQVAPLYESVPPKYYGGTERVVSFLTEELIHQGHTVTLFASGDSVTQARLLSPNQKALRLDATCIDEMAHHIVMLQMVQDEMENFDIVHYHIDYLHFPMSRLTRTPHITTLHGRLNVPELYQVYKTFDDMPVVSISNAQREPLPRANWVGNVYHGLPSSLFKPNYKEGQYLAFLGRISPEKRVDRAIEIAIACGVPLKVAAKVDPNDREYFENKIKKLLNHPLIEFLGEIGEADKEKFLGEAIALLFPIDWPEPFGLVMIEALACGTPVIAYRNGSVPEIIDHGSGGFIINNQEEGVKAVREISSLSRHTCRQIFEQRFTSSAMAEAYIDVYRKMIAYDQKGFELKVMEL
jgi:glycosyltransferase involved in cell wall biosynthesis